MQRRVAAKGLVSVVLSVVFVVVLSMPLGILPPLGGLANPGGGIWTVAEQADHPKRLEVADAALDGTVTVYRDLHGIPHIFATTEHDLFFAQGFVHAQDRMAQMDFMRRVAKGELAEVLGAEIGGLDVVEVDTFHRTIGLASLARNFTQNVDPADPTVPVVDAYVAGVNAFLDRQGGSLLPLEFKLLDYRPRPWTAEDVMAIGLFLAWSLSGTFEDAELALLVDALGADAVDELFPVHGPYQRPVDPRMGTRGDSDGDFALTAGGRLAARDLLARAERVAAFTGGGALLGSNNWAIDGSRTDTGSPRLANDPHLSLQMPSVWYQNHLVAEAFDAYGVSFPGVPVVVLGQNRHIAWGATNVGADVVDLYRETVDGNRYFFRGEWKDLIPRVETIRVKGGEPVTVTVRSTIHGPLVTEDGETFAMRWTGQEPSRILRTFYGFDRARNWDEFREATRYYGAPAQNFVYADVDGHIGMRSPGLYPIRENFTGRLPLDGASGDFEWSGWVPLWEFPEPFYNAVPESFDPPEGFVLSANQQVAHDGFPYYMGWSWDPGYRARRILEMLENDTSVTFEEFRAMQLDTLDVMAREFVPFVEQAVGGSCTTATCADALAALSAWNFRMEDDLAAPAVWWRFANHIREEIFGDEWIEADIVGRMLPMPNVVEHMFKANPTSRWFDDVRTATVAETWGDIVARAFGLAVDHLRMEMGDDVATWRWGDIHSREFPHLLQLEALGRGPYPSEGDTLTVNVAPGDVASAGPSWRLLADLSGLNRSVGVYPGGQSGNPVSRHYDDLLRLYLAGEYHDLLVPASASEMPAASIESTLILRRP